MEGEPDVPENAKETDNLVPTSEVEGNDELVAEITTLLSELPSRPSEAMDSSSRPSDSSRQHQPHPYHLKNKYTFRSDSVYSDVVPISAASQPHSNKTSEPREKSGSLSSLKAKESKWMTLKKKLGRLNSSSSAVTSNSSSSQKPSTDENKKEGGEKRQPSKSLNEKRSLFQRAKTLSILPVHKASKDKEDSHPQPKRVHEPPELFNVGSEMDFIPLELLIDVNSMGCRK